LILFLISMGAQASASVRINAGATSSFTDSGNTWLPDQYFTGGATYANSNSISGTSYPQVYGKERYGGGHASFGYAIPLANGNYNVSLDFAETYVSGPGQRIFSVSINGTQVLTNFDIYAAAGGMNIAVQRTFPVTVSNGILSVNFIPGSVENPKINGMEVVETSGSGSGGTSALEITTSQVPSGILSKSYTAALSASGGTTPYTWSLASGSLPTGLTLSSAGTISGAPTSAGSFPFTVQVTDAASHSASANLSINVANPVVSVAIASPANGATVSGTVTVSGTASDTVSVSSVQVSVDNGVYSNASGTTNWSYSLNTASLSNGSHSLTAKATDAAGLSAVSSVVNVSVSNGSLASDCTLFASPSGNDSHSGTSASSPKTFQGAANATQPGSVVCLLGGTYNFSSSFTPPSSGTPSSWITYKNYGDGPVNIVYTGPADASPIFRLGSGSFPTGGVSYIEFRGLNLNGNSNSGDAFWCQGTHHLRFTNKLLPHLHPGGH